jgi:hypothetical protein
MSASASMLCAQLSCVHTVVHRMDTRCNQLAPTLVPQSTTRIQQPELLLSSLGLAELLSSYCLPALLQLAAAGTGCRAGGSSSTRTCV